MEVVVEWWPLLRDSSDGWREEGNVVIRSQEESFLCRLPEVQIQHPPFRFNSPQRQPIHVAISCHIVRHCVEQ